MGIGLCCEAAAELVVSREEKVGLKLLSADGEAVESDPEELVFFELRNRILEGIQNRELGITERFEAVKRLVCGATNSIGVSEAVKMLYGLECLDPDWKSLLDEIAEQIEVEKTETLQNSLGRDIDVAFEQIAVYFIYRHRVSKS